MSTAMKSLSQNSQSQDQDSNSGPSEYETGVWATQPWCLV